MERIDEIKIIKIIYRVKLDGGKWRSRPKRSRVEGVRLFKEKGLNSQESGR